MIVFLKVRIRGGFFEAIPFSFEAFLESVETFKAHNMAYKFVITFAGSIETSADR